MTTRPVALITGASSGIGAALALAFADRGHDLVLLARRRDRLDQIATRAGERGASVETFLVDLSTAEGLSLATERAGAGDLQVLISNAGTSGYGPLSDVPAGDLDAMWRLNATAPVTLAHAVLPSLLAKGDGSIVTVASMLAFSSGVNAPTMPTRTLYVAAKSATVAFTRTLAGELTGTGVHAMVVCPGRVATEWNSGANMDDAAMAPEDVATAIAAAVARREMICMPGLQEAEALDGFLAAERALFIQGGGRQLADRYAAATN